MQYLQPHYITLKEHQQRPPQYGEEPLVSVGIVGGQRLTLHFDGPYTTGHSRLEGRVEAQLDAGAIVLDGQRYAELVAATRRSGPTLLYRRRDHLG